MSVYGMSGDMSSFTRSCVLLSAGAAAGFLCACAFGPRRSKSLPSAASIRSDIEISRAGSRTDAELPDLDLANPDKENFVVVFDYIVKELKVFDSQNLEPNMVEWVEEVHRYNVPHGKLNRGLAVVAACKMLSSDSMKSKKNYFSACVVGWCIEWAFFLVADDIMDHSITRRGQPCWYKVPKVGLMAVNDCCILEGSIYRVLKQYAKDLPCYPELVELFQEVTYATTMGQLLDMLTAPDGKDNFENYNLTLYSQIVKWKTAFYTFYLPTASALQLCGVKEPVHYETAKKICMMIGEFFQIQDDFLDCYGAPEVIGKIGTDIEDNKCSWLVCQANYGKSNPTSVAQVKALYKELKLEERYLAYEQEAHANITAVIEKEVGKAQIPLYRWYLGKIFKRDK